MERMTKKEQLAGHTVNYVGVDDCFDVWSVPKKFMGNAIDRLATIEDILGNDYDLDRLRELIQADRDGRCVVLSGKSKKSETIRDLVKIIEWISDSVKKARFFTFPNRSRCAGKYVPCCKGIPECN